MNFADFKGHHVTISFREPVDANGHAVKRMEGEMGDVQGTVFTLNAITAALDVAGNNVTKEARLLHGAIAGNVLNIASIESLTPVHRDDDDDD
jgi:ribosome maturation factor RimP